jgi:hypothetical protein
MARSSGLSKVLVLVHLVLIYLPNSPLKRCLNYFSDSFVKPSEKSHERTKRLTIKRIMAT